VTEPSRQTGVDRAGLTVAIATLGRPAGLARCLDALLSAEMPPAQIVVVDQGHDELTPAVVAERRAAQVPITYLRQTQRGLSASRNAAVGLATAASIAFTDDDCVPGPNWVAVIIRTLSAEPDVAALGGRVLPWGPETSESYAVSLRPSVRRQDFRTNALPWLVGSGGNFAVRRDWLARVGPFDERLGAGSPGLAGEDMDLIHRLLRAGAHLRFEPDSVIYHERQPRSGLLARCSSYGFGMGSFLGIWLRQGDRSAVRMSAAWLFMLARETAALVIKQHNWFVARERVLSLSGTARGLVHGLKMGAAG
jgi:GT2 family glycosyltransferase